MKRKLKEMTTNMKPLTVSLPPDAFDALGELAWRNRSSKSELLRELALNLLKQQPNNGNAT